MISVPSGSPPYRGRFAPSPTGELHFGSLVAALGSWLDARAAGGEWLLRIEDIDSPRCVPGAEAAILRALDFMGLYWDGPVLRQSERLEAYTEALAVLKRHGDVYPCTCSRSEIKASATGRAADGAWIYPGTCRSRPRRHDRPVAWRVRVTSDTIGFDDRLQGILAENLERDVGDFVVRRSDGRFAYQLAVVVDDAWQSISDVVRGADLLDSTPRQIWLQRRLGLSQPRYLHLPVAINAMGEKLSKQTRARPLDAASAAAELGAALRFLGHDPEGAVDPSSTGELLDWARSHWDAGRLPRCRSRLPEFDGAGDDQRARP